MKLALDRWNFGRELGSLQREMDRLFNQMSAGLPQTFASKPVDFVPACDIDENETGYTMAIDVPGFKKDQLKIEFADGVLTVSGEYRDEKKTEKKNQRMTERAQGYFERSFNLPQAGDAGKIEASYADGVLHVTVPKTPVAKSKQIPIGEAAPAKKSVAA